MNPLSVSQLTQQIQQVLESELAPVFWVVGELADFRVAPQGHAYFELVEKQENKLLAKIRGNIWQFNYRTIAAKFESITRTSLKNGMKVLAQVTVNFHPLYGLSITVKDIDPSFSLGERSRIRQETIDRLTREGLLRLNGNLPLPIVIQRIAVISSPTAAGYGDFINQLDQNGYGYQVSHQLFPSLMQGNEAVGTLISALDKILLQSENRTFDAVILIRGGGAQLDLDCFDDYELAKKIAAYPIPVLTGIGHERDETIADLVAHTRLKTPTAVAEFILESFRIFEENLGLSLRRLDRATRSKLREESTKIQQLELRLRGKSMQMLNSNTDRITTLSKRILMGANSTLKIQTVELDNLARGIKKSTKLLLDQQEAKLTFLESQLRQLDPDAIFKRGYTRSEVNGSPIGSGDITEGATLKTYAEKMILTSTITQIEKK